MFWLHNKTVFIEKIHTIVYTFRNTGLEYTSYILKQILNKGHGKKESLKLSTLKQLKMTLEITGEICTNSKKLSLIMLMLEILPKRFLYKCIYILKQAFVPF